jgi:hypothetical protein
VTPPNHAANPLDKRHRDTPADAAPPKVDPTVPHTGRIWNYWLGGKDHVTADRAVGDPALLTHLGTLTRARVSLFKTPTRLRVSPR